MGISRFKRGTKSVKIQGLLKKPRSTVEQQESSNEDAHIERFGKLETIRLDHLLNMMEHTRGPKKIEHANVMREVRKCVKNVSTFG